MWHYTSYGIYIGVSGSLFGCILGPNTITRALMPDLAVLYTLHSYQMKMYWFNVILISIIIILCTGGISAYSSYRLLNEMPADLLRARLPKKGSHIFLEQIPILWNRMKFSHKLIARNLVKNKMRFFMSVFGIMGCMALILGAFSLRQTMLETASITYGSVYTYDERYDRSYNFFEDCPRISHLICHSIYFVRIRFYKSLLYALESFSFSEQGN